jgi:hypothetical protein
MANWWSFLDANFSSICTSVVPAYINTDFYLDFRSDEKTVF